MKISKEQIAHDLAMVYVNNRYGAEVTGDFSVGTSGGDVTGSGSVETRRLPDTGKVRKIKVPTGEKTFMGLLEKKESVDAGYAVDVVFDEMINDYFDAYLRFLELLDRR